MKKLHFLLLITFIFGFVSISSAQDSALIRLKTENIKQIFIRDLQDLEAAGSYSTIYEIVPASGQFQIYRIQQNYRLESTETLRNFDLVQSDKKTKIKDIPSAQITELINAMKAPAKDASIADLIGSNWRKNELPKLITNAEINNQKLSTGELNNCLSLIDQEKIKDADLVKFFNTKWSMDHPEIAVYFITATDTLGLISKNLQPYMLPWKINGKTISYNKNVSKALAAIIPALHYSNVQRLSGKYFEEDFAVFMVEQYCRGPIEKQRLKQQYNQHFLKLEQQFQVLDYEYGQKSDIEIDDQFLEIKLKSKELPSNFHYAAKFSRKGNGLIAADPFLNKYAQYNSTLKKADWLLQMLKENNAEVEVTFADDRSFTQRAENFFTNDTKGFIAKNNLQNSIKDAVLIKVTEGRGKNSRWIILPDGSVILWHYKGNKALNFTDEQLGFINSKEPLKVVGKYINQQGLVK